MSLKEQEQEKKIIIACLGCLVLFCAHNSFTAPLVLRVFEAYRNFFLTKSSVSFLHRTIGQSAVKSLSSNFFSLILSQTFFSFVSPSCKVYVSNNQIRELIQLEVQTSTSSYLLLIHLETIVYYWTNKVRFFVSWQSSIFAAKTSWIFL